MILCALIIEVAASYLIATSTLESCLDTADSPLSCETKLLITLSLQNSQAQDTESLEITVKEASTDTGTQALLTPIRISLSKTQVTARYPLRYLRDFNSNPREKVVFSSIFDCEEDPYADDPTCGWQQDSNKQRIWDSQGFCCECSFLELLGFNTFKRAELCESFNLGVGSATAHCLSWDELWYSAYEVGSFTSHYEITADVVRPGSGGEYIGEQIKVSPSVPVQLSESGGGVLRLVGDFYPNEPPPSLNHYFLFAASRPTGHSRRQLGSGYWMFIGKDEVSFDGKECGKIGTSYSAFRHQGNNCQKPVQSCLENSLEKKHAADLERVSKGVMPLYFISKAGNFSMFSENSEVYLQMGMPGRFSTLVTLEVSGDSLRFVTVLGAGEIDYAVVVEFEALSFDGKLAVQATNTGNAAANYILGGRCAEGVTPLQSREFSLAPYASYSTEFSLYVERTVEGDYYCNVTLYDARGEVLDSELVQFNTTTRHTDVGSQGGNGADVGDAVEQQRVGTVSCSVFCTEWYDLPCFFAKGCWENVLFFFGVLVVVLCGIILLKCCIKNYGICCQKLYRTPQKPQPRTRHQATTTASEDP